LIVVTGAGRSGTSMLAHAYAVAGARVSGEWDPTIRAGLEDERIVGLNKRICHDLGVSLLGYRSDPINLSRVGSAKLREFAKRRLSKEKRTQIKKVLHGRRSNRMSFHGIPWDLVDNVGVRHGSALRCAANEVSFAKDPLFSLTLPVWLAAGARIDHVVLTSRRIDEMVASRQAAGHLGHKNENDTRNTFIYAHGVALASVEDAGIRYTRFRYPDSLTDLPRLAQMLPLPEGMCTNDILAALESVVDQAALGEVTGES